MLLPRFEFRQGGFGAGKYFGGSPFGGGKGDSQPTPNYGAVTNVANNSAATMSALSDRQMTETKNQYDINSSALHPLADASAGSAIGAYGYGGQLYGMGINGQAPLLGAINKEALAAGSEGRQEEAAGRAVADVRQGTTSSLNQAIRQGLRYGYSPDKISSMVGANMSRQGLAEATAANAARVGERDAGFNKQLTAAGLYNNLYTAGSQAMGAGSTAGSTAVNAQMSPSAAYSGGVYQSADLAAKGLGLQQQGYGAALNAETNAYTASRNQGNPMMGLLGMGLGAWANNGFSTSWFGGGGGGGNSAPSDLADTSYI